MRKWTVAVQGKGWDDKRGLLNREKGHTQCVTHSFVKKDGDVANEKDG